MSGLRFVWGTISRSRAGIRRHVERCLLIALRERRRIARAETILGVHMSADAVARDGETTRKLGDKRLERRGGLGCRRALGRILDEHLLYQIPEERRDVLRERSRLVDELGEPHGRVRALPGAGRTGEGHPARDRMEEGCPKAPDVGSGADSSRPGFGVAL